tara:strand:+ start:2428 stop:3846 length:1419 start_codon:yes stop_codon:yes gene_type:complete
VEKFDYLANFWFGPRSSVKEFKYEPGKGAIQAAHNFGSWYYKLHHYYLVHAHCKFLSQHKIDNLNKILFVINIHNVDELKSNLDDVKEIIDWYNLDIEVIVHDNTNHSYGAWNCGLKHLLKHKTISKYCFLCEDDYVPTDENFYKPFYDKFSAYSKVRNTENKEVGYVAQLASLMELSVIALKGEKPKKVVYRHAAVSNGFINLGAAKKLNEDGDVFTFFQSIKINQINTYQLGERAREQVIFTEKLTSSGYELKDISDVCYIPFDDNNTNKIKDFGIKDGYCPIKPYKYPDILPLDKMEKKDLKWFLGIRNDDSTRHFLENNNKFTLDEAEKWFDNLDKDNLYPYLLIRNIRKYFDSSTSKYGGIKDHTKLKGMWKEEKYGKFGYVRQNMTEVNGEEMVEIGVDIDPKHRRKGLARAAYVTLLRDLDKASLWVFEDNFARNLYFELGFRDTGETQINRGRKEYRMVWKRRD